VRRLPGNRGPGRPVGSVSAQCGGGGALRAGTV
jgi:hypothetical protein